MKNNKVNKARVLLCGSAVLALIAIYLWKCAGYAGLRKQEGISWRTVEHSRPGRAARDPNHGIDEKPLIVAALPGNPVECCGDGSASCRRIPPSNHLLVFVAVPNVASGTERRFPLREQWHKSLMLMEEKMKKLNTHAAAAGDRPATVPNTRTALRFVIGTESMEQAQLDSIKHESLTHKDILLIDAPDEDHGEPKHRSATTLKVMHSMRYAANNFLFEYFARVGDDAYFRVDFFAELVLLHKVYPRSNAYIGYRIANYVDKASDSTHAFMSGMGFFLTPDLTRYVCRSHALLLDGYPEDVIVGSWFVGTKAQVIHEPRFHDLAEFKTLSSLSCSNNSLLMHHVSRQQHWDAIDEEGLLHC